MEKYLYQDLYKLETKHWWHLSKRKTAIMLLKKYLNSNQPNILDIGCGTGQNVKAFSKLGESFGIDNSKDALLFCRKKGLKNVALGSANKIPFKDNTFEVVTLLDVLEHVKEDTALVEINRVLKKRGLLLVTVPAYQWLWSRWDEVLHHKRRYSKKTLINLLEMHGFKVIKASYLYSFLVLPAILVRSIKSIIPKTGYSSDFKLSSPILNKILVKICNMERALSKFTPIPFGTSLICLATKNEQ